MCVAQNIIYDVYYLIVNQFNNFVEFDFFYFTFSKIIYSNSAKKSKIIELNDFSSPSSSICVQLTRPGHKKKAVRASAQKRYNSRPASPRAEIQIFRLASQFPLYTIRFMILLHLRILPSVVDVDVEVDAQLIYGGDGWTNQRTLFALSPFSIPKTFHPSAYSKLKQWQRDREQ